MVQWIISSSILIVTIICLRSLLKGKLRPGFCYALWLLVAVRLLIPFNIGNSTLSIQNLMDQTTLQRETGDESEYPPVDPAREAFKVYEGMAEIQAEKANEPVLPEIHSSGNQGVNDLDSFKKTDVFLVFVRIWLFGATAFALLFLYSNLRFHKNLNRTRQLLKGQTEKLPVYCTTNLKTPCLFGFIHPTIYVTRSAAEDSEILRHAVAHEMSHYEQGDSWWAFLRCICLVLHWYNPLVWWAAKLSKQDAELACDAATIRKLGEEERLAYGKTLIRLTCEQHQDLLVTATTMTSEKKSIRERIRLIAKKSNFKSYAVVIVLLVGGLVVAGTFTNGVEKGKEAASDTEKESLKEELSKADETASVKTNVELLVEQADSRLREGYVEADLTYVDHSEVDVDFFNDEPWSSAEERDALAQAAIKELYTLTGYNVTECVYTTDGRSRFIFGKSAENIRKCIAFYSRDFGFTLSGDNVPYIGFVNARRFHYSDVQQLDSPYHKEELSGHAAISTWFLEHSGVYQGEKIIGYQAINLDDTVYTHIKLFFDGGYYIVVMDENIESVAEVKGPYYENNLYAAVLEEYYEVLVNVQNGLDVDTDLPFCIVNPYWLWSEHSTADILSKIVYAYKDLDGDGTEELLLGWAGNEFWNLDEGYVFAIYTLNQGEPVLAVEGWERNLFVVGRDGCLYNRGSSSAWESNYTKYRFNPAYEDYLEPIEEIHSYWSETKQDKEWVHLTDTKDILSFYQDGIENVTADIIMDAELAYETGEQWMESGMIFEYELFEDWK